jgi:hypothetical protein
MSSTEDRFTGGLKAGLCNASIPLAELTLHADSLRVDLRWPARFLVGWWVRAREIPYESIQGLGLVRSSFGTRGLEVVTRNRRLLVFWYRPSDEPALLLQLRQRGLTVVDLNRSVGIFTTRSSRIAGTPEG